MSNVARWINRRSRVRWQTWSKVKKAMREERERWTGKNKKKGAKR